MTNKQVISTVMDLMEHCDSYDSCDRCILKMENKKCMLRNMTLAEVLVELAEPVIRRTRQIWVMFKDMEAAEEHLNYLDGISHNNNHRDWGDANEKNEIIVYLQNEAQKRVMRCDWDVSDDVIEELKNKIGPEKIKIVDSTKGE
ncbi:hypothetical protein [Parasporobacterium paucivorans]|uniref:Uncharacterized protein n=1 Tax=Parasporobacterium paucivorans DSM 15970 TaxID=1122934 RepID=A0A1M6F3W2_9FIRM|nr:hypothetical protein [Parasporobacterium paucivorans]SHI92365.1 hypothetical protein SAMN02745691_01043 [Parasporobacterium paucivorans DSM 15970]